MYIYIFCVCLNYNYEPSVPQNESTTADSTNWDQAWIDFHSFWHAPIMFGPKYNCKLCSSFYVQRDVKF